MKKTFLICFMLVISLCMIYPGYSDDTTSIPAMTEDTTPTSDDLVMTINDPAGSPGARKVTLENLFGLLQTQSINAETKTDTYSITTSDLGKSFRMNSSSAKTFNLPSVGTDEDGGRVTFIKQGAGKLTVDAADSDYIHDSAAGSTVESSTNHATITLEYVHGNTRWVIISATGTWITS